MIRKILILVLCVITGKMLVAAIPSYPVSSIPPELLKHADVVIRLYDKRFVIKSYSRAILTVHKVTTIFTENEKDKASLVVNYDKCSRVSGMKGYVYNSSGQMIRKFSGSDIADRSMISDFSLYEDDRCKTVSYTPSGYPVTVEYEYEKEFSDRPEYPDWEPQPAANVAVEQSKFTMDCPGDLTFRYLELNLPQPVQIGKSEKCKTFSWAINNVPAFIDEPFSPDIGEIVPLVMTAPAHISYKDYDDDFTTWESLGKWQLYLNQGRDELDPGTQAKVRNMVKDVTDKKEKIRIIYKYLQSKTRYISIQVDIGGWQPFPASFVDKYGYGDCKALTNYIRALLKAAGIDSYFTLVMAGKNAEIVRSDFPDWQFNHAFLCVPCDSDTIWLECTSQDNPFGFLGTFTDDRQALVVSPSGSRLVSTPRYGAEENLRSRTAVVNFDESFNATASIKTTYIGIKYNEIEYLLDEPFDEQKRKLSKTLDLPDFVVRNVSFESIKEKIPQAEENLSLYIPRYASITGGRVFIPVNLLDKETYIPQKLDKRQTEIHFRRDDHDIDTIIYNIPAGLNTERIPDPVSIKSVFGNYTARTILEGQKLTYIRNYTTFKGHYPPDSYPELIDFCKKVVKADRDNVVFVVRN